MHVLLSEPSGLTKRSISQAAELFPLKKAAKKPTAKEMREAEKQAAAKETMENIEGACSVSEGGSESDDHGSELGVPPEVAAEDAREAAREADRVALEEKYRERERERHEEECEEADHESSSVEEVEDAFPHCPPPPHLSDVEKDTWLDTVALVKLCRQQGTKVPVKIPSDLDGKWSNAQKLIWVAAKAELNKVKRRMDAVRRRAGDKKAPAKAGGGEKGKEGHTEDPEAVAASGVAGRSAPSQPPFTGNEKARLVHCIASQEFRPCVEVMLRGVTERVEIDDKLSRVNVFKELATVFNNDEIVFDNFFADHPHGDEELRGLDPNLFRERTESFLKREYDGRLTIVPYLSTYVLAFVL